MWIVGSNVLRVTCRSYGAKFLFYLGAINISLRWSETPGASA
jgi:hypothetical protein